MLWIKMLIVTCTVPTWVTAASSPLGTLIGWETEEVMFLTREGWQIIWFVTSVSIIQCLFEEEEERQREIPATEDECGLEERTVWIGRWWIILTVQQGYKVLILLLCQWQAWVKCDLKRAMRNSICLWFVKLMVGRIPVKFVTLINNMASHLAMGANGCCCIFRFEIVG